MGIYLSLPRLPIDWAIDLVSGRRDIRDVKRERRDFIEGGHRFWLDDASDDAPRKLNFNTFYVRALDAMTGTLHNSFPHEFFDDEPDDPRFWTIYGARRIGWERSDFPLRYSLPSDIQRINDCLETMKVEMVREHVEQVLVESDDRYTSEVSQTWMREQAVPRLLPALKQFYGAAQETDEMVIYWLH